MDQFESEKDIELRKKARRAAWEKVRNGADESLSEEEVKDSRPLFQQLQAQRDKKDLEWKEASQAIIELEKAADAKHINEVNKIKFLYEIDLIQNDKKEIEEFKRKSLLWQEEEKNAMKNRSSHSITLRSMKTVNMTNKQKELIQKAVRRGPPSAAKVVAILPGIGHYDSNDSSSGSSSSSELDSTTLVQKASKKTQKDCEE